MLRSLRERLTPRESAGQLPALLLDQDSLPSRHQAREVEQPLRLVKQPGGIPRVVILLLGGVFFCCLGVLLFLPATAPEVSSALAVEEEVQERDRRPVNAYLLTTLLLVGASFGVSVLWLTTNARRRRGTICSLSFDERPWLAAAREGPSFLGVFRL
jgi:hypothetical protein